MTYLPKTISRDVAVFIGTNPVHEIGLTYKLQANPLILLKFVMQASSSHLWIVEHSQFVSRLFAVIRNLYVLKYIPWHSIIQVVDIVTKATPAFARLKMHDDMRNFGPFSSLVIPRHCSKVHEAILQTSNWSEKTISDSLTILKQIEEKPYLFKLLFDSFFTGQFYGLVNSNADLLQIALAQCQVWGYEMGVKEIQKIMSLSSSEVGVVFSQLSIARLNGYSLLEERCLKFLSEVNYTTCIKPKGAHHMYIQVSYTQKIEPVLSAEEKEAITKGILENKNKLFSGMRMGTFEIIKDKGNVSAFLFHYDDQQLENLRNEIDFQNKVKLSREGYRMLSISNICNLSASQILGLMSYFGFEELGLENIGYLPPTFFSHLGQLTPNLQVLVITNCKLDEAEFSTIALSLPSLKELTLCMEIFTKVDTIEKVLNLKLVYLNLSFSKFQLPKVLPDLSSLKEVDFTYVKFLNHDSLQSFWQAAYNLNTISVSELDNFKLDEFPNPQMIIEMSLDCSQLEPHIIKNEIPVLLKFTQLKTISLNGAPSKALKPILLNFIRNANIIIKFIG